MDHVQAEWEKLAGLRRTVRGIYLAHMLVYVLVLVLLAAKVQIPAVVLGVVNMLISLLYVRRRAVAYSDQATRLNIRLGLCAPLEDAACTGKDGMSQQDFTALQMLPTGSSKGDGLMCHNGFAGRGFGMELRGFEATMAYPYQGNAKRTLYRYLNGSVLTADGLPQGHQRGDWLLLRRGLLVDEAQRTFVQRCGYYSLTDPDAAEGALENDFYIYTHTPDAELPQHLRRRLAQLVQAAPDAAAVRLTPQGAAVYLQDQFYTVTIPLHYLPEPKQIAANPLPQRDAVWELFRYWAKAD